MKLNTSILFSGLLLSSTSAFSGGVALTENDCLDLLEKWAADPNSVPAHLVNHCRDMMTAGGQRNPAGIPVNSAGIPIIEPAAGRPGSDSNKDAMGVTDPASSAADDGADMHRAGTPISLADDPCSGSSAAGSVYCWGPWTSLAPAAGPVVAAADQVRTNDPLIIERPEFYPDPELGDVEGPVTPPNVDLPLGSCQPGQSCGFATLVEGTTTRGDSEDTKLVPFDLEQDGSQFIVDAGGPDEIISNDNMEARYRTNPIGQENMVSEGTIGNVESKLQARVFRDDNGDILQSADIWKHGDIIRPETNTSFNGNSGEYAWGITSSQATLDALNTGGQGISATFSGLMAVDQGTEAVMTVNFGSQPTWTGQWENPAYNFSAGGTVTGADLISNSDKFSDNVNPDNSYVQGALLGEQNDQSVTHAIDVNLDVVGNIKDVGLLRAAQ